VTTWLIDKSALVRMSSSPDASLWAERLDRGLLRICPVTLLKVGFSAREREADRAVSAGEITVHASEDDFLGLGRAF
jgi:predicted nucleic acid-binding protein